MPELLLATARELVETLDGDACLVSRQIGQVLVEVATHSRTGQSPDSDHGYLVTSYPLTEEVLTHAAPRLVFLGDQQADAAEASLLRKLGFDALLMLPLRVDGKCWGLVEVYRAGRGRFDHGDVDRAEPIVARTGLLLENLDG